MKLRSQGALAMIGAAVYIAGRTRCSIGLEALSKIESPVEGKIAYPLDDADFVRPFNYELHRLVSIFWFAARNARDYQ